MSFSVSNTLKIPLKKQKSMKYIQSGCKNWQPEYNDKTGGSEFEEYRLFLLNYKDVNIDDEVAYATWVEKFQTCYPAQRFFLNNCNDPPTATDIASVWPCLFHKLFLHIHFLLLTNIDINVFATNFEKNLLKLLAYGLNKKFITSEQLNTEDRYWMAISIIFCHFKEDKDKLFSVLPVSISFKYETYCYSLN